MKKSFSYLNSNISYRISGKGIPVMLLHGFAEDSHIWDLQVDALQKYAALILPDLPGSGKSIFNKKEKASSTIEYYADCMHALLQHENIKGCIMLGHSMGGYITLAFAEKYPSIVKAFGLVHSTAFEDSEEKKNIRRKGIELMKEYGSYSFIKNTTPNLFSLSFKKKYPERVDAFIESGKQFTAEALQNYYSAMLNRTGRANVLNTAKPVLFVMGKEDTAAPLNDLLQQVYLPAIAYIYIFKNVGHMGMQEATKKLNKCLTDFVNDVIEFNRQ